MSVKGYKVFNPDWTCRQKFLYKVGESYTCEKPIELCACGFHFCRRLADCFSYYHFDPKNKVAEIEAFGDVIDGDEKSVTNGIKIIREMTWEEVLTLVNIGNHCTGHHNVGHSNAGNYNTGDCNTGYLNAGGYNKGSYNCGSYNAGDHNTGDWNLGDWNTGSYNKGNGNSGYYNEGFCNTGDCNTGDNNVGRFNVNNNCIGCFNTESGSIYMFNKPTSLTWGQIMTHRGMGVLKCFYKNIIWVKTFAMTDEEKEEHPEYKIAGGYLKQIPFKEAFRRMWIILSDIDKQAIMELPNFDPEVFKEITGIDVNEKEEDSNDC